MCPEENCPDDPDFVYADRVNNQVEERRAWSFFDTGYNCKVVVKAINLNGKLKVEIQEVKGTDLLVFEMPNDWDTDKYKSTGIFENNRVYKATDGVFYVPTDWSIILSYNPKFGGGRIKFKYWVEDYTSDDVGRINGEW